MSIIQDIREKYAKVTVVLIALALLGFILTDYFSGKGRAGSFAGAKSVGKVNGKSISANEFTQQVEMTEANMKAQGYPASASLTQQARQQTWDREVAKILLSGEFDKLGIAVGKKELGDILYGANAPQDLQNQFKDQQTGLYNPIMAKQAIDQQLKKGTAEQKENINSYLNQLADQRMSEKYISLLTNTINFPRWFIEKQNADNSQMAKISMVKETYASIPDSSVKIEDKEITAYINKHKKDFKQEESRSISYVTFNAAPSTADSADIKSKLAALKPTLQNAQNIEQFLASEGTTNYYDGYINGKAIQIAAKDSIFKIPVGEVYGPYLDGGNYVIARLVGVKQMPDTVKVRHILIATTQRDPQSGQSYQTRDSATAYNLADSIQKAIAKGSSFDTLCVKFSDDPGSKDKGGVYENVPSGQMVAPFNDFIFLNPTGTKGIVKTDFGYHYIEILSQKGSSPAYNIAYLPKEIFASQETDNTALNAANQFAGDSPDLKTFDENYEKQLKAKGTQKGIATDIKPVDADIRGLGNSRTLVRNIYDAKKGEVLRPERVEDKYVVAVVTDIFNEGTQGVAKARPMVEPVLRNKKKAEMLIKKIGKVSTLEAAATALGGKQIETADSLRMNNNSSLSASLGYEPRVIGAAFNPTNKGKVVSQALEGINGVYVVRVDNVTTTAVTTGSVAEQRQSKAQQTRQYVSNPNGPLNPLNILKNAATIKDNRAEIY